MSTPEKIDLSRRFAQCRPRPSIQIRCALIALALAEDEVWVTDITEHDTGEGKLYVCVIKDLFSNRIV